MSRLATELRRLYLGPQGEGDAQVGADGRTRVAVLELVGPAPWEPLSRVWQGVQADLEWPAPGIAVNGVDGCQLWFSLAESVPLPQAMAMLEALRGRYLADVRPERVRLNPATPFPPAQLGPDRWSAFLAPDLAALFAEEPWLDLPPGADAQAELLGQLRSIPAAGLHRAFEAVERQPVAPAPAPPAQPLLPTVAAPPAVYQEPRSFLLAVMNDPAVEMGLRIAAAQALLAHGEGPRHD